MKVFQQRLFACLSLIVLLVLSGCVHTIRRESLMSISLGMSKENIIRKLGNPSICRGSIKNQHDQVIEILEYNIEKGKDGIRIIRELLLVLCSLGLAAPILLTQGEIDTFWLYFHDNNLVQWGKAGDWKEAADHIQEFRFR